MSPSINAVAGLVYSPQSLPIDPPEQAALPYSHYIYHFFISITHHSFIDERGYVIRDVFSAQLGSMLAKMKDSKKSQ